MHILQIVADGTPGGGTTNVLALTEDLIAVGETVSLCSQAGSYALQNARLLGARTFDDVNFFRGRLDFGVVRSVRRIVDESMPDVIHVHGGRAAMAFVRGLPNCFGGATVYTVRGYHFLRKGVAMRWLAAAAERKISHQIDRTVHVCRYDQRLAGEWRFLPSAKQSSVVYNGIRNSDIPFCTPTSPRTRVAVLGRLTRQKNPHLVLDIAQALSGDGFEFELIGGGDMEAEVRSRVRSQRIQNVTVRGELSRGDGLAIMSQCGSFLLASRWEGLPIAPVEAMQMGLAVVVSRVSGNCEIVEDGITGRTVDCFDLAGYVNALRRVVSEVKQTNVMIERGKAKVNESFTRTRVVQQYLSIYHQLLGDVASEHESTLRRAS